MTQLSNQDVNPLTGEVLDNYEERSIVPFQPTDMPVLIRGMQMPQGMSFEDRVNALAYMTELVQGSANSIKDFINVPIEVLGVVTHDVTVRNSESTTIDAVRTVLLVGASGRGEEREVYQPPLRVTFVSKAAARFFEGTMIPMFGLGRWEQPITMVVKSIPTKLGNTFSFSVRHYSGADARQTPVTVSPAQ